MARHGGFLLLALLGPCSSFRTMTRPDHFTARTRGLDTADACFSARTRKAGGEEGGTLAKAAAIFQPRRQGGCPVVLWAEGGNGRGGDEDSDQELSRDAISADGDNGADDDVGQAGEAAANMELRDFRARLMSKGLDGWGSTGEGAGSDGERAAASSERWAHPLVRPELGCLVVANGDLFTQHQQYFYKAVILIIQHGDDGSVGLILNRPTTFTMGDVCTGDLHRVPGMEDNVLYMGGDVAGARDDGMDVVNLMHGRDDVEGMEVVKGLRLGGLKEALALIAAGTASPEEFKFFSRYAGWGPGQLEAEVLSGVWTLAACDIGSVLQNHNHPDQPGHFWNEIVSRLRR